jgi:hypothetical protein
MLGMQVSILARRVPIETVAVAGLERLASPVVDRNRAARPVWTPRRFGLDTGTS